MVPTKISSGDDAKELLKAFANRCKFDVYLHACRLDYAGSESVEGSKKPMGEVFKKINSMKQICMDKARVLHHDTPDVLYSKYIEMLPTLSDDARTKWTTQLCIAYYNGLSQELKDKMDHLRMDVEFARRYVNDGFSGGEMKRAEILQLAMLQPKFAVLDETDSGLDADAVRLASESIADIGHKKMGLLIITHHDKLLEHNPPQFTHVMLGGRLVETGGKELAEELHEGGYDRIRKAYPEAEAINQEMVAEETAV